MSKKCLIILVSVVFLCCNKSVNALDELPDPTITSYANHYRGLAVLDIDKMFDNVPTTTYATDAATNHGWVHNPLSMDPTDGTWAAFDFGQNVSISGIMYQNRRGGSANYIYCMRLVFSTDATFDAGDPTVDIDVIQDELPNEYRFPIQSARYVLWEVTATLDWGGYEGNNAGGTEMAFLPPLPTAYAPSPAIETGLFQDNVTLSWLSGQLPGGQPPVAHNLYFGTDPNDVENATPVDPEYVDHLTATTYEKTGLSFGTPYYWRVDEVYDVNSIEKGSLWVFYILSVSDTMPVLDGLQLHLDASDESSVMVDENNMVTQWQDLSANGYHMDPNSLQESPQYVADGLRTLPTVHFDGNDDSLKFVNSMIDNTLGITNDYTIFVVWQGQDEDGVLARNILSIGSEPLSPAPLENRSQLDIYYNRTITLVSWVTVPSDVGSYVAIAGVWPADIGMASTFIRSGSDMIIRNDSEQVALLTGNAGPIDFNTDPVLRLGKGGMSPMKGSISEVAIFNRTLSFMEYAQVEAYLDQKWMVDYCGMENQVYNDADFNKDCVVDLLDFAVFVNEWLDCTDASGVNCQ